MKVAELIARLHELPQDKDIEDLPLSDNKDFNIGLLLGLTIANLANLQSNSFDANTQKNRYSNISGNYEKYLERLK